MTLELITFAMPCAPIRARKQLVACLLARCTTTQRGGRTDPYTDPYTLIRMSESCADFVASAQAQRRREDEPNPAARPVGDAVPAAAQPEPVRRAAAAARRAGRRLQQGGGSGATAARAGSVAGQLPRQGPRRPHPQGAPLSLNGGFTWFCCQAAGVPCVLPVPGYDAVGIAPRCSSDMDESSK